MPSCMATSSSAGGITPEPRDRLCSRRPRAREGVACAIVERPRVASVAWVRPACGARRRWAARSARSGCDGSAALLAPPTLQRRLSRRRSRATFDVRRRPRDAGLRRRPSSSTLSSPAPTTKILLDPPARDHAAGRVRLQRVRRARPAPSVGQLDFNFGSDHVFDLDPSRLHDPAPRDRREQRLRRQPQERQLRRRHRRHRRPTRSGGGGEHVFTITMPSGGTNFGRRLLVLRHRHALHAARRHRAAPGDAGQLRRRRSSRSRSIPTPATRPTTRACRRSSYARTVPVQVPEPGPALASLAAVASLGALREATPLDRAQAELRGASAASVGSAAIAARSARGSSARRRRRVDAVVVAAHAQLDGAAVERVQRAAHGGRLVDAVRDQDAARRHALRRERQVRDRAATPACARCDRGRRRRRRSPGRSGAARAPARRARRRRRLRRRARRGRSGGARRRPRRGRTRRRPRARAARSRAPGARRCRRRDRGSAPSAAATPAAPAAAPRARPTRSPSPRRRATTTRRRCRRSPARGRASSRECGSVPPSRGTVQCARAAHAPAHPVATPIVEIALPVPVDSLFSYAVPAALAELAQPGCRALVPFGPRRLAGLIVARSESGAAPPRECAARDRARARCRRRSSRRA